MYTSNDLTTHNFSSRGKGFGTGYDYPDLPGLGNNNEKLGLPERLSTGVIWYFEPHGKLNPGSIYL
jgi:hypothetical protein